MFNRQGFKAHANNVLLWLWISEVSHESNSTAELKLMWMYFALYSILIRRRLNCSCQNVNYSTILRYFSKSRSWSHFYHPLSRIVLSHTPSGGFQRNSDSMLQTALVNASQPFKCKAVSSLAAYATWTNPLVPSSLTLWISSICIKDPSACAI